METEIFTGTLNSPLTAWVKITDEEMERMDRVIFTTPSGREVEFEKIRHAEWITKEPLPRTYGRPRAMCPRCGAFALYEMVNCGSYAEK